MRTFFILLRKEIRELITWQTVLPLALTAVMFVGIGNVIGNQQKQQKLTQPIIVVDRDKSTASITLEDALSRTNFDVKDTPDQPVSELLKTAENQKAPVIIIVPQGFGNGLAAGHQQTLETYGIVHNFSLAANQSTAVLSAVFDALNSYFSRQLIITNTTLDPTAALQPITTSEHVVVGNRVAAGKVENVLGFVQAQTVFIPIIFFFVIVFAAQMIATAVASEKENKTIETLLTMPISRRQIVSAKMLAAGIVALLSSVIYLFGFRSYINGVSGGALSETSKLAGDAVQQLGLTLTPLSYALLGAALFLGILVTLAIAMILGTFAEDVKSVQGLITPLMILVMIPYILTLFLDIPSLGPWARLAIYAIPFTHAFQAAPNLFLHQTNTVLAGIAYLTVCFVVFVFIAAMIFTTDRIVTMKLSWGKKKTPLL